MQSGEFNTCKPALGYEIVNGNLVIIEEEAETVRRIFNMFLAGIAKERIAQILTEEGVPTKTGKTKWYASTVCYILTNERYMGDALLQKRYTTDTLPFKKKHNHGEKEQYYVENSNVPIVSKEIFQAVCYYDCAVDCVTQHVAKLSSDDEHIYFGYGVSIKYTPWERSYGLGTVEEWLINVYIEGETEMAMNAKFS